MPTQFIAGDFEAEPRLLRVLLIEDSVEDALLLERHLRRTGFRPLITRIETAEDMQHELATGALALPEPADGPPCPRLDWDLILADYNLPSFSAPEALGLLKETARDIPFIMMSGAVSEETAVAAMRAGAHDYVSKENLTRLAPAIEREIAEAVSRKRKRAAERALAQSEERFHRLVDATPLALLIADMQGRVVYANAGVERLLGFTQQEVESGSLTLESILPSPEGPADSRQSALASLLTMSLARPGETFERTCLDHAGALHPVLLGAAILNPEEQPEQQQMAAFLVDLSEQKRSEEVLRRTEKLAAAGRLAASIAHEINNPLEAITNCLYLLQQSQLSEEAGSYLRMAQQELDRVSHIATQTLRFYRQNSRPTKTDITDLLETVLTLYEPRLRDHSIAVVRDYRSAPPITAYDGEIRQVLANLVGNSLDAMASVGVAQRGSPRPARLILRVRLSRDWKSGEPRVAVTVSDTGIGMSPATLARIWEPFFSTKGLTGTGLGLWVSCEIISKHGGVVRVRSSQKYPMGTVFRLTLPLDRAPEDIVPALRTLPTLSGGI